MGSPTAFVTGLRLYPVKSLRGYDVEAMPVERCGFAGDRRWMVVDPTGRFLTMREVPAMARISVRQEPGGIVLETTLLGSITVPVPPPDAAPTEVTIWRSRVPAVVAKDIAGEWLSEALGMSCRLVHLRDPQARPVDPAYGKRGESVSFADGFPVLLASTASLDDLNGRLERKLPITRFRPNLIVSGAERWAEDTWQRVRIGEAIFRVAKPCERCIVTTMDQETGERPVKDEPLRTLAKFRRAEAGVMFGQNLVPETIGRVAVGDEVTVLEAGLSNFVPVH